MAKKWVLILTLILVFAFGFFKNKPKPTVLGLEVSSGNGSTYRPTTSIHIPVVVKEPSKIVIPKLSVEASVEPVGKDSEGKMDVPSIDTNAGWWKFGAMPGNKGSAVIAGHYDRKDGGPAIFYDLKKLAKGDTIKIEDVSGEELVFEVVEVASYKVDDFPLEKVFGKTNEKRLNLITCDGTWDKLNKNYSDRLVVFTKLLE